MRNLEAGKTSLKTKDIEPAQIRAARGFLGWTRSDLAKRTGLSAETIKNTEQQIYYPKEETIKAITNAFAKHGVEMTCHEISAFVPAEGSSPSQTVKMSYASVTNMHLSIHEGLEGDKQ